MYEIISELYAVLGMRGYPQFSVLSYFSTENLTICAGSSCNTSNMFLGHTQFEVSQNRSVGTATFYGLDGPAFESR